MRAQTLCNPSAFGLDGHLSQGQPLLPSTHSTSNSAEGIHPLPAKKITPASPPQPQETASTKPRHCARITANIIQEQTRSQTAPGRGIDR